MDEQQPASESPRPASATTPAALGSSRDPGADRAMLITGGLLAGLGLSLACAFVMHLVQEVSPIGSAFSITGNVLLEFFIAGPIFGLGVALAITSLIPPGAATARRADPATAPPAMPGATERPAP